MPAIYRSGFSTQNRSQAPQRIGGALALAMHLLVLTGLLMYSPARQALVAAAPIMVEFISLPKATAPAPQPARQPAVQARPATRPSPVATPVAQALAPSAVASLPVQPPAPLIAPAPAPSSAPGLQAVAATTSPAVKAPMPAPLQTTQPVYAADTLDNPAPSYPAVARRNGEQGRVVLRVHVNEGGTTDEVQVRTSSGFMRLDDAARDTVRRWKFIPARHGTEPVAAWVLIPISFRLEG